MFLLLLVTGKFTLILQINGRMQYFSVGLCMGDTSSSTLHGTLTTFYVLSALVMWCSLSSTWGSDGWAVRESLLVRFPDCAKWRCVLGQGTSPYLPLGKCPCTHCKSLWIRASAEWLNVNVVPNSGIYCLWILFLHYTRSSVIASSVGGQCGGVCDYGSIP